MEINTQRKGKMLNSKPSKFKPFAFGSTASKKPLITINGKAFLLARQMMLMQSCSNDDVKKPKQNYFMLFSTCNFIILSRLWKQTAPADKRRTLESYSKFCMCLYLLITACREWNLARLRILNSHQNKPLRSFLWGAESLRKCTVQN